MGFFSKNWTRELDRAEEFLASDVPVAALEIAERAERKADPDSRGRAAGLVLRARQALLTSVLERADEAEAAGDLEDAAEWLRSAIEREASAVRKAELEARVRGLIDRSLDRENAWDGGKASVTVTAGGAVHEGDVHHQYEMLATMLSDEVRDLYEQRPPEFQQAVVTLHQGRADEVLEVLEEFASSAPEDAIAHLELGRAKLFVGDAGAARDDLEVAWKILGDEPLDAGRTVLMPVLWAEAALAAGDATKVVERLRARASSDTAPPEICRIYGTALMAAGRLERAVEYLEETVLLFDRDSELDLLLARALRAAGDHDRARAVLERSIDPSCHGGCSAGPPHPPSFRFLAQLHLLEGGEPERARELMAWIAKAQSGYLGPEELDILAGYYRAIGDSEAAAAAALEGERLAAAEDGARGAVDPELSQGAGRAL